MVDPAGELRGHRHGLQVVSIISADVGWYVEAECKHVWASIPDATPAGLADLVHS